MDARRATSTKWTAFPPELNQQIKDVFKNGFEKQLPDAEIMAAGRIYPEEVTLEVGYRLPGRLRQDNFEASMDYDSKKLNADEVLLKLVDIVGAFLQSFLEAQRLEEELDLPRQWQKHQVGKQVAYLRYNTVNSALEAEANKLLGLSDQELVKDHEDSEDALERASVKVKITKKNS